MPGETAGKKHVSSEQQRVHQGAEGQRAQQQAARGTKADYPATSDLIGEAAASEEATRAAAAEAQATQPKCVRAGARACVCARALAAQAPSAVMLAPAQPPSLATHRAARSPCCARVQHAAECPRRLAPHDHAPEPGRRGGGLHRGRARRQRAGVSGGQGGAVPALGKGDGVRLGGRCCCALRKIVHPGAPMRAAPAAAGRLYAAARTCRAASRTCGWSRGRWWSRRQVRGCALPRRAPLSCGRAA